MKVINLSLIESVVIAMYRDTAPKSILVKNIEQFILEDINMRIEGRTYSVGVTLRDGKEVYVPCEELTNTRYIMQNIDGKWCVVRETYEHVEE